MSNKEDSIKTTGVILREEGKGFFRVTLDKPEGHTCLCRSSGRLIKYKIHLLAGDEVTVELSPYDLTKGRIITRGT